MLQKTRLENLDLIRGFSVFLMIIFHFCFDLNYFSIISFDIYHGLFWKYFRFVIVFLFLFCVGYSIVLSTNIINIKNIFKRLFILLLSSNIITFTTYFIFPNSWIYFGILHFIFVSSIVSLFFIRLNAIALFILSIFLYYLYIQNIIDTSFIYNYFKDVLNLPNKTEDLVRFLPWFSVILFGMAMAKISFLEKIKFNKSSKILSFFSKNSLLVYLIHQPVLFGSLFVLTKYI